MKIKTLIIILLFIVILFLCMQLHIGTNLWFLLTDNVYMIPKESSVFSFKPVVMNSGSGDWWIYGEDSRNYYYFTGDNKIKYIVFPKKDINDCPGFKALDIRTWCISKELKALIK